MAAVDVASAGALTTAIPDQLNAATYFVDRNVDEGRGENTAIEYVLRQAQDERIEHITYLQVLERVNRVGNALRDVLNVRLEERVVLLLLDCPEFVYSFFGAMKIGAVPVPTNTLFKPPDYEYILNDSRARVVIVSEALLPQLQAIPSANPQSTPTRGPTSSRKRATASSAFSSCSREGISACWLATAQP